VLVYGGFPLSAAHVVDGVRHQVSGISTEPEIRSPEPEPVGAPAGE
jgi:hypothetical protein